MRWGRLVPRRAAVLLALVACVYYRAAVREDAVRAEATRAAIAASLSDTAGASAAMAPQVPWSRPAVVEPSLRKVLSFDAERMREQMLPRAKDPMCRKKIAQTADYIEHEFERYLPRHEFAEKECAVDTLQGLPPAKNGGNDAYTPWAAGVVRDELTGKPKCGSTLVFAMLLDVGADPAQLERVLSRVVHRDHFYHFQIDSSAPREARLRLADRLEQLLIRYGPSAGHHITWEDIDVVYTGVSLLKAYILAWRDALRLWGTNWDHILNYSPADYPMRSVPFMSRWLARQGTYSYASSWVQSADGAWNRASGDWLVECPTEQDSGYVFRLSSELKPVCRHSDLSCSHCIITRAASHQLVLPVQRLAGMQLYGGTAWTTLHRDFVNYTWGCLAKSEILDAATAAADDGGDDDDCDDPYCHSLQGLLRYLETNFCPEELFVQTALLNGPFCTTLNGPNMGNLRWESWDIKNASMFVVARADKHTNRPGPFNMQYAHNVRKQNAPPAQCQHGHGKFNAAACLGLGQKLLARKFDIRNGEGPYNMIDELAKDWDTATLESVLPCQGDEMVFTDSHAVVKSGLVGCFKDSMAARAMTGTLMAKLSDNSPVRCADHCSQNGFAFAGLQYGIECYCANDESYAMHGKVDEHRCSARCPGDHAENCGGFLVMDVYDVSKMSKAPVIPPNPP